MRKIMTSLSKARKNSFTLNPKLSEDVLKGIAIRSAGITITERIIEYAINTISVIILARLLTPTDFGLVAMVASIAGIFGIFRDLGISDITVQAAELNQTQVSTLFWVSAIFNAAIAILLIACSPLISKFYREPRLIGIAIIYSLSFIFVGLSTQHFALFKRSMRFGQIAIIGITSTILSVVIAIIMAAGGFGYWSIIAKQVTLGLFLTLGAWAFLPWKPGRPVFTKEIWRMIGMGLNIVGFFVLNYFVLNIDKTIIGWRLGADQLGYYDRAFQLAIMPISLLAMPLHAVAVSALSKLKNERGKYIKYYLNSLVVLNFIGIPVSAFLFLKSDDIVYLLLGPKWAFTGKLFKIFSVGIWAGITYGTHGWLHISLGRTDRWLRWGLISAPCFVAAYFIGINWGPIGVACAYTIILVMLVFPSILYGGKPINLNIKALLSYLWRYFVSGVISLFICIPLLPLIKDLNIWLRIILTSFMYAILYILFLIILFRNIKPIFYLVDLFRDYVKKKNG